MICRISVARPVVRVQCLLFYLKTPLADFKQLHPVDF